VADNKAVVRRFIDEVFNQGNLTTLDEVVDVGFVEHEAFPGLSADRAGLSTFVTTLRDAFPDLNFEIVAMVGEGDEVWIHNISRGTHKGEFMGVPATGNSVEVAAIDRVRMRDGRIVEHWGVTDIMTMMQQLGVVPVPESAPV
jgi:steroid delta-isomerase-like uncharacterized protein